MATIQKNKNRFRKNFNNYKKKKKKGGPNLKNSNGSLKKKLN
jgi:hypothetical protein